MLSEPLTVDLPASAPTIVVASLTSPPVHVPRSSGKARVLARRTWQDTEETPKLSADLGNS